ncbi:ABC transporter ATP-binding protein [Cesiribacter andamanensis]|uniref:Putative multidrug export ATP-binding/permease protein n=1 Tax=Cesiribacter andamanensis AMV16 TaxID=1279009 RepID=M7N064_9BACT|nr:ABC transporter ATP-binding protein [Cesiribacter andamanensis]EMR00687.1 Putative multidrug export ATP-binding/permease protein [Cesiribacter andamanensis AMV16]
MNLYFRLLSFARPLGLRIPKYIVFTLLSILFGIARLTLLIPILSVLFNQTPAEELEKYTRTPSFTLSFDWVLHVFYHNLLQWRDEYGVFGSLVFVCIIIVIASLLTSLFTYLSNIELAHIRVQAVSNLRKGIYDKVTRLHLGFFTNERKGDLMSRITNDVQEVESSIVNSITVFFREPATIIVYFIVLFSISYKLTLFTVLVLPISGYIISGIAKRLKRKATESQESLGRIVNMLDETIGGMRVVKAFTARDFVFRRFAREVDHYGDVNMHMARRNELASPISEFLGIFFVVCILLYGGSLVIDGTSELAAAAFIGYIAIFTQVLQPGKAISKSFTSIQRGLSAGERIFQVLDVTPVITDKAGAQPAKSFEHSLEFRGVSFAYGETRSGETRSGETRSGETRSGETRVLQDINLKIEKGKTIALVGPSGGGKSTLADLVARFYDPTEGAVLLDGKPLTDYQVESLQQLMGIVTQESILFNDTIFNNIAFGMPEAREEEVIRAAKIANAHDFIMQTEGGYQTLIGERGGRLSGGQRQRLSIARAVLKNPPILILDEATSALDSESERLVQEALTKLMEGRTSIVIAHRLSTIQHADEILVIQQGRVVEQGSHEALLEQEGLYKKLSLMQSV